MLKVILMQAPLIRLAGALGSAGERVVRQSFPLNRINARLLTQDTYYSGEKARIELRMLVSPVSRAIEEAMAWLESGLQAQRF